MNAKLHLCSVLGAFVFITSVAQVKKDSIPEKSYTRKTLEKGIGLISTNSTNTISKELSIDAFKVYENKIIRKIYIEFIGLERSIYDSSKRINKIVSNVANTLHSTTREIVIRSHLFIHENKPLNPFLLSDNERFLRDLDFILDARFIVTPIEGTDSVDITSITRDVFSLGANAGGSPTAPKFSIYDANVAGLGQRVQFSGLADVDRSPNFGSSIYYRKSSWLGSLTNIELAFTQLNSGISQGGENEFAYYARINRPLVSPYSRLAGGFEVSNNWSANVYKKPDSAFLNYRYKIFDTWVGYNIGIKNKIENRNRHFLALRYLNNYFTEVPGQKGYSDLAEYNSAKGWLGEITFYRKNFFKTRYIFGFGRTEDVPFGISTSFTAGYVRQIQIDRPYAAVKLNYSKANKSGNFYLLKFESGTYYRNNKVEDFLTMTEATFYTRAFNANQYKIRSFLRGGYSQLVNRATNNYVKVSKSQVYGLSADSLLGTQQFYARVETTLYSPWSLMGFRFAPFAGLDWSHLDCTFCEESRPNVFGINAGLRTRNENLIFGTMEIRFTYIPDDARGNNQFKINFRQNLQIKNTGNFIVAPSLISN